MATASTNGHHNGVHISVDEPENPLHRLSAEQIEEIGREFEALHEAVKADLGDRDARYIRSVISMQRKLALIGRIEMFAAHWRGPWLWAPPPSAWPRSSRTWRSATTSCTASGTG